MPRRGEHVPQAGSGRAPARPQAAGGLPRQQSRVGRAGSGRHPPGRGVQRRPGLWHCGSPAVRRSASPARRAPRRGPALGGPRGKRCYAAGTKPLAWPLLPRGRPASPRPGQSSPPAARALPRVASNTQRLAVPAGHPAAPGLLVPPSPPRGAGLPQQCPWSGAGRRLAGLPLRAGQGRAGHPRGGTTRAACVGETRPAAPCRSPPQSGPRRARLRVLKRHLKVIATAGSSSGPPHAPRRCPARRYLTNYRRSCARRLRSRPCKLGFNCAVKHFYKTPIFAFVKRRD